MTTNEKLIHEYACLKADYEVAKAIIELIPPCPLHGAGCKEYKLEWIAEKKLNKPNKKRTIPQRIMNFLTTIK